MKDAAARTPAAAERTISQEEIAAAVAALDAVERIKLEKHGRRVLDRMKNNARACAALAAIMKKKPGDGVLLLNACVDAELLARTFNERVAEERRTIGRTDGLEKHVAELRRFVDDVTRPADSLAAWFVVSDEESASVRDALDRLAGWIAVRRQLVTDNLARWGASRKSAPANKRAAENAAIGWIAAAVEQIAGKPLTHHVAVLAEVALDIGEISEERVRGTRSRRDLKSGAFDP